MVQNDEESRCPVCGENEVGVTPIQSAVAYEPPTGLLQNRTHTDNAYHFHCPSCGPFVVTFCDRKNIDNGPNCGRWKRSHLSALVREQTLAGVPLFWIQDGMDPYGPIEWRTPMVTINVDELLQRWPRSIPERMDRALCNLARSSPIGGSKVPITRSNYSLLFAEGVDEAHYFVESLEKQDMLNVLRAAKDDVFCKVALTPAGWKKFDVRARCQNVC